MNIKSPIYFSLLAIGLLVSLGSCGAKDGKESAEKEEAHGHEHGASEPTTVASLTQEQIKEVGIAFGSIEQKALTATIKANGILRVPNNNRSNVTPLYGGSIRTLNVQLGDQVRKGQVIATIVNPQFIQLQEDYLNTVNEILLAEQELQRQQELNAGNAGIKRNLQSASSNLNILKTKRASLAQQLNVLGISAAKISAGNLRSVIAVVSPINGVVSNVFLKLGSYVDVSSPIVEIVDNSMIHLDLQVFEKDLPHLKIGQDISFTTVNNPDQTYVAKISKLGASFENDSKSIAVHCVVTGDKTDLIDGMNTTGIISMSDVTTPAVPEDAIVEANGKYYIFIETDKKAEEDGEHEHAHENEQGHEHAEGEAEHDHSKGEAHDHAHEHGITFEKIEVIKGVSNMGYTGITPVQELSPDVKVVIKGAFFINAKMSGAVGHSH